MATSILSLPAYLTAKDLAECELSSRDGVPVDAQGGISREDFLLFCDRVSREAALVIFTSKNPDHPISQ